MLAHDDKGLTLKVERQVTDLQANSAVTHEPATPSQLLRSTSLSEESASLRETPSGADESKED